MARASACVSRMHGASCEIGTQTSVVMAPAPGREASVA